MIKIYKIICNCGAVIWRCAAVFYICFFCFSGAASAEDRIYKIEAAFLYNFFDYVTWPEYDSPETLKNPTICIYGNDSLYEALEYVKRKKIEERHLQIKKLSDSGPVSGCNIIFVSNDYAGQSPPMQSLLSQTNALIISDKEGFLDNGGMMELTEDEGRIGISVNNSLLSKLGFSVSSRLLSIAKRVE